MLYLSRFFDKKKKSTGGANRGNDMAAKRKFREPDEATRQKMSLKKRGESNPNYGKPLPDEVRKKISDKLKRYWATVPSRREVNGEG